MVLKQHPTVEFEEKLIMFFPDFLENFLTKWCGFFKTKKGGVEIGLYQMQSPFIYSHPR